MSCLSTTVPAVLAVLLLLSSPRARAQEPRADTPAPAAEAVPESPSGAPTVGTDPAAWSRVVLTDGQVLVARVVGEDGARLDLELAGGATLSLPRTSVARVEPTSRVHVTQDGRVSHEDPARTRYLYAPSAMMLRRGQGYFSQKELLFSSVAYGVTDWLTVLGGAALPLYFLDEGVNFIGGVKVGGPVGGPLHLAAGAETLVLPSLGVVGFVFGASTLGGPDAHATLAVGAPFAVDGGGEDDLGRVLFTLNGTVRLGRGLALVSENWLAPYDERDDPYGQGRGVRLINAAALRIFGERMAVDVGLVRVPDAGFPIPWLDFSYHFG